MTPALRPTSSLSPDPGPDPNPSSGPPSSPGPASGPSPAARPDARASARRTFSAEQAGLAALSEALAGPLGSAFADTVEAILSARGRVIVAGVGKSGHIGRKIAATLASTGTPAYFVHAGEASHGDLGMIVPEDVILALSWSGETPELSALIDYAIRFRVRLVALTSEAQSSLGRAASLVLLLPKVPEACPNGLAPTTSSLMQLALGDAIAVALLESRGFSDRDFRVFHPGGRLGAQLRLVRDVMHVGAALPVVGPDTPIPEAIDVITAKGFGAVLVVDGEGLLVGIVTDGDTRRALARRLTEGAVARIMTAGPKTLSPDALAAHALLVMNDAKFSVLPVVEGGRPVGILHLQDLLKAGVV